MLLNDCSSSEYADRIVDLLINEKLSMNDICEVLEDAKQRFQRLVILRFERSGTTSQKRFCRARLLDGEMSRETVLNRIDALEKGEIRELIKELLDILNNSEYQQGAISKPKEEKAEVI